MGTHAIPWPILFENHVLNRCHNQLFHVVLQVSLSALFCVRQARKSFDLSIVDLKGHFQASNPIMTVFILELINVFAPRKQPRPMNHSLSNEDNILAMQTNRVVKAHHSLFDKFTGSIPDELSCFILSMIGDQSMDYLFDNVA